MWVIVVVIPLHLVTGEKHSQLLLQPTRVKFGLQVRVEFDKKLSVGSGYWGYVLTLA